MGSASGKFRYSFKTFLAKTGVIRSSLNSQSHVFVSAETRGETSNKPAGSSIEKLLRGAKMSSSMSGA